MLPYLILTQNLLHTHLMC